MQFDLLWVYFNLLHTILALLEAFHSGMISHHSYRFDDEWYNLVQTIVCDTSRLNNACKARFGDINPLARSLVPLQKPISEKDKANIDPIIPSAPREDRM